MKKFILLSVMTAALLALAGCAKGGASKEEEDGKKSQYTEAVEVLTAVFDLYAEEDMFAAYGGNQENPVMDAPGKFDISRTEELDYMLGLPQDAVSDIEDAASMIHLMNGNVFTGAAYRIKEGMDMNAFADTVKTGVLARQWMCGQPDTLVIIKVDESYVITAYGEAGIIELFRDNALSALEGAEVITEVPVE